MPAESKTAAMKSPKIRSSIRHSLNLASMSKALVDVMTIDNTRKSSGRRSSTLGSQLPPAAAPTAPRASMGDVRPPSQVAKRTSTPESKTLTRRRVSVSSYARSSSDEQSNKPIAQESGSPQRHNVLRPKNTSSALPKYRQKSSVNEPPIQKQPSPVKVGTRRRLSSSDDEKKGQNDTTPTVDKSIRPINPLPQRAALKTNVNSINVTPPPGTPPKVKSIVSPSSGSRSSSIRPTKIVKTSAVPRPPSSTSSVASLHPPNTPKSPKISESKSRFGLSRPGNNVEKSGGTPSKMMHSPFNRDSPSPLSRRSRQTPKTTPNSSMMSSNMSHISEGASESGDSDLENVELLLAPVAALGAPTPAMPRIQALKRCGNPQTPSRSRLPKRENLSYLSPEPPASDKSNSSLRRPPGSGDAPRGSIMSWEQLAAEASRSIGEDEFGRMLADVPAPFRSGPASPSLSSHLGLPDSPGLSVIDSPGGGYGSISQVLLPDVTPSPAVGHIQQNRFYLTPDASKSAVDSSAATLLRLQLASMENTAKERLKQMQAMEEEIHNMKQAHAQQMEEMQKQLQYMESQNRANDERISKMFKASLEEQLRQQRITQEDEFRQTMTHFQDNAKITHGRVLHVERARMNAVASANLAGSKWGEVVNVCEVELDFVRADRAMLAFLQAQVDQVSTALKH